MTFAEIFTANYFMCTRKLLPFRFLLKTLEKYVQKDKKSNCGTIKSNLLKINIRLLPIYLLKRLLLN